MANYHENDYLIDIKTSICGRKLDYDEIYKDFSMKSKNAFYIKYK
jgi:hypothetical protein